VQSSIDSDVHSSTSFPEQQPGERNIRPKLGVDRLHWEHPGIRAPCCFWRPVMPDVHGWVWEYLATELGHAVETDFCFAFQTWLGQRTAETWLS